MSLELRQWMLGCRFRDPRLRSALGPPRDGPVRLAPERCVNASGRPSGHARLACVGPLELVSSAGSPVPPVRHIVQHEYEAMGAHVEFTEKQVRRRHPERGRHAAVGEELPPIKRHPPAHAEGLRIVAGQLDHHAGRIVFPPDNLNPKYATELSHSHAYLPHIDRFNAALAPPSNALGSDRLVKPPGGDGLGAVDHGFASGSAEPRDWSSFLRRTRRNPTLRCGRNEG